MLITLPRSAICQSVAEVQLTGVATLEAASHRLNLNVLFNEKRVSEVARGSRTTGWERDSVRQVSQGNTLSDASVTVQTVDIAVTLARTQLARSEWVSRLYPFIPCVSSPPVSMHLLFLL